MVKQKKEQQVLPGLLPFPALLGKRQVCELQEWRSVEHMRDYTRLPVPRISCLEIPSHQLDMRLLCGSLGNHVVLTTTCVFLPFFLMLMFNTKGLFYVYLCTDPEIVFLGIFLNEIMYHNFSVGTYISALTLTMPNLNDPI